MTGQAQLSVVMATYNRAETLRETIHHLADQELDPSVYEVIIIDDGSTDNTREVVEEAQTQVQFRLIYLHHPNRGAGYTQNRGIRSARAPIILLMADDIFQSRRSLREHLDFHTAHPELEVAALGCVRQSPQLESKTMFLRTWDPFRYSDFEGLTELPYYRFWACNISVKQEFLLQNALFRESMGRGGAASHEDAELGYRLQQHGLRILYCPAALGFHHHVVTLRQACERAYSMGLNFGEFNQSVPVPELAVAYHVFSLGTIGDHLRIWFGPRRKFVPPGDRNPLLLLARYLIRGIGFNGATVRYFWMPLFERAERDPRTARFVRAPFYRGLIAYHFFRGCREGPSKFRELDLQRL